AILKQNAKWNRAIFFVWEFRLILEILIELLNSSKEERKQVSGRLFYYRVVEGLMEFEYQLNCRDLLFPHAIHALVSFNRYWVPQDFLNHVVGTSKRIRVEDGRRSNESPGRQQPSERQSFFLIKRFLKKK
uniref:Uncharacterized protein n=1 Tax=Strigamia maritima TaxID=126957 RepID=T1JMZ7_STRMM